jgi:hypothetical protein
LDGGKGYGMEGWRERVAVMVRWGVIFLGGWRLFAVLVIILVIRFIIFLLWR